MRRQLSTGDAIVIATILICTLVWFFAIGAVYWANVEPEEFSGFLLAIWWGPPVLGWLVVYSMIDD